MSCKYNEVDGVWQDKAVRDIQQGDGRRWTANFENDITGMIGEIAFKRKKTDTDADAVLILASALAAPDSVTGEINSMLFELGDAQSAALPLGALHFGLRVKLDGITTTLIDQLIKVRLSNPTEV